ncbi:MAG: glycosyltransferase [Vicingus serpentipes]|nr:glycosyltransferase [Vicingus serpentipes]
MPADYLILIPTYNERENVEKIFSKVNALNLNLDVLFVDDNSTDGTKEVLNQLSTSHKNLYVINRPGKMGIGSAHQDGIKWAYDKGYETLISMDCDLTHSPSDIPLFIENSKNHEIVVGSRYMQKDSIDTWNMYRKFLTRLGHFLTTTLLGMEYDASGAFRLYRLSKIDQRVFGLIESKTYSFFFESLLVLHLNQYQITEIPIKLPARTYGSSKMTLNDMILSLRMLAKMFWKKTLHKRKMLIKK